MITQLKQIIISSYKNEPRDVATTPFNREPKWFYVFSDGYDVFVESGRSHANKSNIKTRRALDVHNLEKIYELYTLRKQGKLRRSEATDITQNSSYWFGIFSDLHL